MPVKSLKRWLSLVTVGSPTCMNSMHLSFATVGSLFSFEVSSSGEGDSALVRLSAWAQCVTVASRLRLDRLNNGLVLPEMALCGWAPVCARSRPAAIIWLFLLVTFTRTRVL